MSADNRNVHTDALATLGTIIDPKKEKRDAIHLAVIPATAATALKAGQHVGLDENGQARAIGVESLGIVDPFITRPLRAGEGFWLVIYPRQINSLRHVWTHPNIPDDVVAAAPISPEQLEAIRAEYYSELEASGVIDCCA